MAVSPSFRTIDDAAKAATLMIGEGSDLEDVWRHAVVQMLDDYSSNLRHGGTTAAAVMWERAPRLTGDRRVDAALAALGEHLSRRDGWRAPEWFGDTTREAEPWWFVTSLRGMHARALVESPLSSENAEYSSPAAHSRA